MKTSSEKRGYRVVRARRKTATLINKGIAALLLSAASGMAGANTIITYISMTVLDGQDATEVVDHVRHAGLSNCKPVVDVSFNKLVVVQLRCDGLRDVAEARTFTEKALTGGLIPFAMIGNVSISMGPPAKAQD